MAAFNSSLVPEGDSLDHQMANLGVTDEQLPPVGQARRMFNVNAAGNVMINAGRTLAGTLAQETLKLRISEARKTFIPTESFRHVQRILDQFGHVTISGASGEGKTTMAYMLSKDYMKKGYQVVFVEKVDAFDFNECISSAHKLVLIVDDVFGTVGLSTDTSHLKHLMSSIRTHMQKVKQVSGYIQPRTGQQKAQHPPDGDKDQQDEQEKQKDIRVVFTSKTYNFKDGISRLQYERMSMFTGHTFVELSTDKDHCYSDEEKIAMFQKHKAMNPKVQAENISTEDLLNTDTTLFGFPLTCRLLFEFAFSSDNIKDFFTHPLFYLRIELNDILSRNNNQAAALMLMLLCEDKLDLAKLELQGRDKTIDELFQQLTEIIPTATRQGTATAARHFKGTFFTGGETLSFAHSSIYDACACAMYKSNPAFVLRYCSFRFLFERLKEGSGKEATVSDHLHFLFLSDNYYELFATRLVEAVMKNSFSKIFTQPVLKNSKFSRMLMQKLQALSTSNATDFIRLRDKDKGILYWIVQGYNNGLIYEIEDMFHIKFTQEEIREALVGCVEKDNLILLKYLFAKVEKAIHHSINQQLLLLSGENGSWEITQYLLKEGTNLLTYDNEKQNIIHLACLFERTDMLKSFIEHIDSLVTRDDYLSAINSVDIDGRTPALLAAARGSWQCYNLLSHDSNLDVLDINRGGIIHFAAEHGNIDIVQHVLTPANINSRQINGWTPVMIATACGHHSVFDFLVLNNADLTLVSNAGDSVLHLACRQDNIDIIQRVLTPSNVNSRGRLGWTPVMKAACGELSVFDFLVSNNADLTLLSDDGDSVLHLACQADNRDIAQRVLTSSNINSRGRHALTPVMKAAVCGHHDVFDFLVSSNADLTLVSNDDDSVLHLACQGSNRDIVQHVLTPSNINSRGRHGLTPVMMNAVYGHHDVFDFLVSNNADLTLVSNDDDSVLHLACQGGNRDIAQHVLTPSNINSRGQYGWTPVMTAAVGGYLNLFDFLGSNNADLTLVDNSGDSVLHLACRGGNRDIVKHIMSPSNINSRGLHGCTPVMMAALRGHHSVFDFLVSNDADLTLVDDNGDSVLHLACRGGNRDIVKHIMSPSNINSRGLHGCTPVMMAALRGHLSVFAFLISNNADLSMVDNNGDSVLHLACHGDDRDIVRYLLDASNINSRGKHGCTPVMKAAVWGRLSVFDFLVSNNADLTLVSNNGDSVLHLACQGGNRVIVQHVLTPSNINTRGQHGWTPVMNAVANGHLNLFYVLGSKHADLTLVDNYDDSVLHLACQTGNRDIVQHVLMPSNINSRGRNCQTPVMMTAVGGHFNLFDFLVSNNADITLVDYFGDSVLHLACEGGNIDIVKHVLTPSNKNNRGENGLTPVMKAAVSGHLSVFLFLVSNNADLTLVSHVGDSVLHLACQGGNRDIVQQVLTPSNVNRRGNLGRTPVMHAVYFGHMDIMELLIDNQADLLLVDNSGQYLAAYALANGKLDIVYGPKSETNCSIM